MANARKTKRDFYNEIKVIVKDNEELVKFIDHELELLDKKNKNKSSKPTKSQVENNAIKDKIVEYLKEVGEPVRIADLQKNGFDYSPQKISALFRQLTSEEDGRVEKIYEKKIAYFKAV